MNDMNELEERLDRIDSQIHALEAAITGFKIDKQKMLQADNKVIPGIGLKVAYDQHGRITGNMQVTQDDIPELPIQKVSGLTRELEDKASKSEINALSVKIDSFGNHTRTVKTGTVVNVDEHGLVNEVLPLMPEDIPTLPLEKIANLPEIINQLRTPNEHDNDINTIHQTVAPGIASKVIWDENGHITGYKELSVEDLPSTLNERISRLEALVADMTTRSELNEVIASINNKVNKPINPIQPGVYTKVVVDSYGMIQDATELTSNDIPDIPITHVHGLNERLADTATMTNLEELSKTIQNQIFELSHKGNNSQIQQQVSVDEFNQLKNAYEHLSGLVNTLLTSIPGDQILQELDDVKQDLSTIAGRLAVLERN